MARQSSIACCAAFAALVIAGCGKDARSGASAPGGAAAPASSSAPSASLDPTHPIVEIDTSLGKMRLRLDAVNAPGTVNNFLNYVGDGFYTDTMFHYVDADKMIVGGGFSVDGRPKVAGTTVRNEANNGLKNVRGTIAMARDKSAGIDNATSQFFVNLADSPSFDYRGEEADAYGYCVFGQVIEGLDVADQISRSATQDQGGDLAHTPAPPVIVKSIKVSN